jgi:hypothetical protein
VSRQPQVLAALGKSKHLSGQGSGRPIQPRRAGPRKFLSAKHAVLDDRHGRFGATDWAAFHSTIRGRLNPNCLQYAATYIRVIKSADSYIDIRLGDGGEAVLGGSVLFGATDFYSYSTSHAQTNLSMSDILKTSPNYLFLLSLYLGEAIFPAPQYRAHVTPTPDFEIAKEPAVGD